MIEGTLKDFHITHYAIHDFSGVRYHTVKPHENDTPIRLLENGDGWIKPDDRLDCSDWKPAKFYISDILYRLDLQGKLP